ncbi:hypothetical protein PLEOSDRAFT_1106155 [Pleurotus ostreatus PC15]|uniref:Uncharacterized protein n=1 Tax=Pleurotus ostreatus (strain PC15) TaxID=1137138 RepID=A0A067NBI3_PLEO1|nr:hypothetical protein PLEOSDRAFT_1106155 [Pleurotus ostreatus PC15]
MARTKQTAKKTTGAIGQRADIPPPTNTFQAGSGQTGTPLQTHTTTSANNDTDGFIAFTSEDLGEDNPNGGKMLSCVKCPRWTCYDIVGDGDGEGCITIASADVLTEDTAFVCPACHRNGSPIAAPYYGFYTKAFEPIEGAVINVSCTTLAFFPKLNTAETLLLLIAVRGAERMDEPAMATYQLLHQVFGRGQGNLHYATIFYDLANSAGSGRYESDIAKAVAFIKSHTCRVVVFFVTHTTPNGDLHFSRPRPANRSKGAAMLPGHSHTPATVLNRIFTEQFLSALQWIPDTSLFLLICGGYCGHTETMEWVNSVVRRQSFREVISFTNKRFQPFWASSFCAKYVQSFYLEDVKYPIAMEQILAGDARLGIASDVVIISRDKDSLPGVRRDLYYWAQEKHSPYGFRIPSQCPTCLRLGTITSSTPSDFHGTKLRIYCTRRTNGKRCTFEQLELIKEGRSKGSELLYGRWFTEIF